MGGISISRTYIQSSLKGGKAAKGSKYKIGDIVMLKSGGPSMTVDGIREHDGRIYCHWFAGNKLHEGVFSPDAIDLEVELNPLKKLKDEGR